MLKYVEVLRASIVRAIFKYFLLLPNLGMRCSASLLVKLNATNFKASWKKCAAVLFSADPIQQASKFREIAAFAKRATGNCLGLIDSVARYRKKLWKSTEGHHQFSRLKQHSPPLLSYMSSVLIYRDHLVPPIFYTFDIVSRHSDYCNKST